MEIPQQYQIAIAVILTAMVNKTKIKIAHENYKDVYWIGGITHKFQVKVNLTKYENGTHINVPLHSIILL